MTDIYIDEINFSSYCKLAGLNKIEEVIVLDKIKPSHTIWCRLLQRKGIKIVEAEFFAGHLITDDGESVFQVARRMAGETALSAAYDIISSEPQLYKLNKMYERNTIRLFIAKQIQFYIDYWIIRALVAQRLSKRKKVQVWLKMPEIIDGRIISNKLYGIDIRFYPSKFILQFRNTKLWIGVIARYIKHLARSLAKSFHLPKEKGVLRSSVLMLKENDTIIEYGLRGQPHWHDSKTLLSNYQKFVIDFHEPVLNIWGNPIKYNKHELYELSSTVFWTAERSERRNQTLSKLRRDRLKTYWSAFKTRSFISKYYLVRVSILLKQAELMGALALWLNSKVFLISENYYALGDAMLLVAPKLNLKTISYQYSNMAFLSPVMMTTADKLLIFSEMYKKLYINNGIEPKEFHITGYLFNGIDEYVRHKSRFHRETLERAGAKFIVCYFDENVGHNRWSLVSKGDHLSELHLLANMVISDPTFAVVIKPQFMSKELIRMYPGDAIISQAVKTGRFLELKEGTYRNNIYPVEAALTADLCVGHKFGGTAALEAAIAGVRTVFLDSYGTKTLWDSIYSKADIEYKSMGAVLDAVKRFRAGSSEKEALGDWGAILHHFDPYRDGRAIERLRNIITGSIKSEKKIA